MKHIKIISVLSVVLALMGTYASARTFNGTEKDVFDSVNKFFGAKKIEALCQKGDIFTWTMRSSEGKYCSIPIVAAYTQIMCKEIKDFAGSGCDLKGKKTLGEKNETAIQYINANRVPLRELGDKEDITRLPTIAQALCTHISKVVPITSQRSFCPWPK